MAGVGDVQSRQPRLMNPAQARGPPPPARPRFQPVDREKTCPLLLRVFTKVREFGEGRSRRTAKDEGQRRRRRATTKGDRGAQTTIEIGDHHLKEDFAVRGKEPKDEVQIYTWKDATLRELTDLVKEVAPAARKRDAKLSFAFVYPDKNGRFVVRPVGTTFSFGNGRRVDDGKTLDELGFQIGDYLSVAIL